MISGRSPPSSSPPSSGHFADAHKELLSNSGRREDPQVEHTPIHLKSAEDLAAAAEASRLAEKVKGRTTEQAIDKPTQDFARKRGSSVSDTMADKFTTGRHDSAGGSAEPRAKSPANATNSDSPTFSNHGEDGDIDPPKVSFDDPIYTSKVSGAYVQLPKLDSEYALPDAVDGTAGQSSAHSDKTSPQASLNFQEKPGAQSVVQDETTLPGNFASPFAHAQPGSFYRALERISGRLQWFNVVTTEKAWRLLEICDIYWTPNVIRYVGFGSARSRLLSYHILTLHPQN